MSCLNLFPYELDNNPSRATFQNGSYALKSYKLVTALSGISPAPSGVRRAPPVVPSIPSEV